MVITSCDKLSSSHVKEYLPIVGLANVNKLRAKLILGADSPAIRENRVTTVQCLSGTGSLRVGGEFLARHYHQRTIYIPVPTWGNHPKVFGLAGLSVLIATMILQLVDLISKGFASGNLDSDTQSVRMFVADGGECIVAQSYAKNLGLYGVRVGALSISSPVFLVVAILQVHTNQRKRHMVNILSVFHIDRFTKIYEISFRRNLVTTTVTSDYLHFDSWIESNVTDDVCPIAVAVRTGRNNDHLALLQL